ncbi:MAG: hypothetical protein WA210_00015 [Burkholderiaceae bacterium]
MTQGHGFSVHRVGLVGAAALLLAACGSTVQVGRDFDISAFENRVERAVTTQAQVRAWLGAPAGTGVAVDSRGERSEEWKYYFGQGSLSGMSQAKFKSLDIRFDAEGKVLSYSWSGETK